MKISPWRFLVIFVSLLSIISFVFIFRENKSTPELAGIPYVFWSGFLVTFIVVLATYLASKVFPFEDPKKP